MAEATTPGGPLDQLTKSNDALSAYYKAVSDYIASNSNPPDFATVLALLEYDELLRKASQQASGTADVSTAVAVEETHNNVAHIREFSMTSKGKADLYQDIQSEYEQSADYHKDRSSLLASMLKGLSQVPYLP